MSGPTWRRATLVDGSEVIINMDRVQHLRPVAAAEDDAILPEAHVYVVFQSVMGSKGQYLLTTTPVEELIRARRQQS